MSNSEQDTDEFLQPESARVGFFSSSLSHARIDVGTVTHCGRLRSENQDHYAVMQRRRSQEVIASDIDFDESLAAEEFAYLLMVADGVGGAAFGEFASRVAIQATWELTTQAASWVMKLKDLDSQQVHDRIQAYVHMIQHALHEQSEADPRLRGMGTTCTAAYVMGRDVVISHIGDSRAYVFRSGTLTQITNDQTLAQKLIAMGCDPSYAAGFHNVLSNCLRTDGETLAEIHHVVLEDNDRLLLCSDGLTKELTDEAIEVRLNSKKKPQQICDELLVEALDNGGRDNVTIIIADILGHRGM